VDLCVLNTRRMKDLLLRNRQQRPHRIVTIGMSEYRIPILPETDHLQEDESWCPRPMVYNFSSLQRIIRDQTGMNYKIVDAGSNDRPGIYKKNGHHCVFQSIFWSLMSLPESRHLSVSSPDIILEVSRSTGVDLSLVRDSTTQRGISLTSIRRIIYCSNT